MPHPMPPIPQPTIPEGANILYEQMENLAVVISELEG